MRTRTKLTPAHLSQPLNIHSVQCGMNVDPATAPKLVFKGATYYFCSEDDKKTFDAAPDKFLAANKNL